MPKYNKPNSVNTIWADSALDVNIDKPTDSYITEGWTQVKPPYEYENWSMNKLHWGLAYYNQLGIPEWDSQTEYQAFKSYVQASDNRLYRCIQTNTNRNPTAGNTAYWEVYEGNRQATSIARGTVELATNNEVIAGLRDDVVVTPSTLQAKKASTTEEGIIRTATNTEVSSGARNDVAITPATLQFRTATTSQSGLVELATTQEAQAGTRNDIALTPESITGIFQMLFPVGSIIMRPTNPGNTIPNGGLGFGTWQKISGRSIIGEGSHTDDRGQTRSFVAGQSEGEYQHKLSTQELPSHSHNATSDNAGYHSHTGYTNYDGVHSHGGVTDYSGDHTHIVYNTAGGNPSTYNIESGGGWSFYKNNNLRTSAAGNHRHGLSIYNAGNHRHYFSTNDAGTHNHTISVSSTGGNAPHNNIHPVFVAPIWYRTA